MAENNKQENNNTEPQQTETSDDTGNEAGGNLRETPAFKAILKQLNEERAARTALEDKLKNEAAEAERKRLEEENNFKEIAARAEAERDRFKAEYEAREVRLRAEARLAGIRDEIAREGALARYMASDDKDLDAFYEDLRKTRPDLWEAPGVTPSQYGSSLGRKAADGDNKTLEQRVADGDEDAQREMFDKIISGVAP